MSSTPFRLLFTRKEAAQALAISCRALDYLLADQKLPCRRIGGRVLITRVALENFANQDHTEYVVPKAA